MSRAALRSAIAAAGLLTLVPGQIDAQQRFYAPSERILVGDGGVVHAIAVGPFDVYAATDYGIIVYDAGRRRWKTPMPVPIEMAATRPSALAFDPAGGALWLGTASGDVFTAAPGFDRWDRVAGGFRGRVESIVSWPADGSVYILAGGEWQRVAGGSFFPERVPVNALPAGVRSRADRLPDDPWFRAAGGTVGLDPRNRRWRLTDTAAGREPGEYWIATDGGGMIRYDTRSDRREWLRWGLAGRGAGSIARLDGTIWIGGDGRDARGGVAWTDPDLSTWGQQFREDGAPSGFVAEIVVFGGATWFAAEDGLFRLTGRPAAHERGAWMRLTSADGLASDRVRSLGVAGGVLWAGTDRGLTAFDATGSPIGPPLFTGQRISRIATRGDTLFVATERGLQALLATSPAAVSPLTAAGGRSPAQRGRIADVVADDSVTFLIVADGVIDPAGPGTPVRDAALDRIGPPLRLALGDGSLWVAGTRGIARRDPSTRSWQAYTVPEDVHAGPIVDVMPAGDHVWAATPAGAVRLRWR